MSIPEPLTFNGDPDDTGRYIGRSTGPRREPDGTAPRVPICHHCGNDCHAIYSLAGIGVFCSSACREAATVPAEQKRSA